jgi:hypothetical protein
MFGAPLPTLLVLVSATIAGARQMAPTMLKANLPSKVCVVCTRPFTWRKKWERCWDEVTTCSKRCNGERRTLNRADKQVEVGGVALSLGAVSLKSDDEDSRSESPVRQDERDERKAAKKVAKGLKRAAREGRADPTMGQKPCDLCAKGVDMLIRCQLDSTDAWSMVCGRCWKLPAVAGGVVDGDGSNPNYRYGGLWRNHHRQGA